MDKSRPPRCLRDLHPALSEWMARCPVRKARRVSSLSQRQRSLSLCVTTKVKNGTLFNASDVATWHSALAQLHVLRMRRMTIISRCDGDLQGCSRSTTLGPIERPYVIAYWEGADKQAYSGCCVWFCGIGGEAAWCGRHIVDWVILDGQRSVWLWSSTWRRLPAVFRRPRTRRHLWYAI